ncbi:secreted protein [Melampsora americana]|nr:secreted protein [Melampsora americana]
MQFFTTLIATATIFTSGSLAAPTYDPIGLANEILSVAAPLTGLSVDPVDPVFLEKRSTNYYAPTSPQVPTASRSVLPTTQTTSLIDQMYGHLETCMNGLEIHLSNIKTHCESTNEANASEKSQSLLNELQAIMALFMTCISGMTLSMRNAMSTGFHVFKSIATEGAIHSMSDFGAVFIKMTATLKDTYTSMTQVTSAHPVIMQTCGGAMVEMSVKFTSITSACVPIEGFSIEVMNKAGKMFQGYQQVGFGFPSFLNVLVQQ